MEGSLKNKLLIAMPDMGDERFKHAVIYICDHDEKGAMGLIINKLLGHVGLEDLLEQMAAHIKILAIDEIDIFFGGPLETDRGFILHSTRYNYESTVKIGDDIAMTGTIDIIHAMAKNEGPDHILFALGYAGWTAGQLEQEITANAWLDCDVDSNLLFHLAPEQKWNAALEKIGVRPEQLSHVAGKA